MENWTSSRKEKSWSLILTIYLIDIYFVEDAIGETRNKQEESDAMRCEWEISENKLEKEKRKSLVGTQLQVFMLSVSYCLDRINVINERSKGYLNK